MPMETTKMWVPESSRRFTHEHDCWLGRHKWEHEVLSCDNDEATCCSVHYIWKPLGMAAIWSVLGVGLMFGLRLGWQANPGLLWFTMFGLIWLSVAGSIAITRPLLLWEKIAFTGALLNLLAVAANGGFMPVVNYSGDGNSIWVAATESTKLSWLVDGVVYPNGSVGDVLIIVPMLLAIAVWCYQKVMHMPMIQGSSSKGVHAAGGVNFMMFGLFGLIAVSLAWG